MGRTTIAQAGATGARVLVKGALVSVFVLVAALKTSASTSACGGKSCLPASDYDQSCTQDSDCVGITEGQLCEQGCIGCTNAAINVRDQGKYQSNVSGFSGTCSCPGVPIGCNAGTCGLATFPSPALEAGSQDGTADGSSGGSSGSSGGIVTIEDSGGSSSSGGGGAVDASDGVADVEIPDAFPASCNAVSFPLVDAAAPTQCAFTPADVSCNADADCGWIVTVGCENCISLVYGVNKTSTARCIPPPCPPPIGPVVDCDATGLYTQDCQLVTGVRDLHAACVNHQCLSFSTQSGP